MTSTPPHPARSQIRAGTSRGGVSSTSPRAFRDPCETPWHTALSFAVTMLLILAALVVLP